ncbi:hypothetical protein [Neisseria shayeganii]|uniref:Tail fiber assembly protein n=1 Tax=Neisseria shayeganii TaxID=607712 RepID=A0A7D7SP87_9NEIS|nr:hypothetical protein [Neisseria shayeganii]QMT40010.1 hypothetical protein H3L94_09145 [Neisseria shayeganii]
MTANIPWTKPVCQLDAAGIYVGQAEADLDVYARDGSYLIPGGCIDTAPPEAREGMATKWTGSGWQYLPDHRGQTAYRTADGQALTIDTVGELPEGLTLLPPPDSCHEWDGAAWTLNPAKAAERLDAHRAEETERINAAVYGVAQPLLRFRAEYELRESQARAYADAGYTGEVPSQVAAFATPANLQPQQATDIILQQAAKLHAALDQLATLRMRKFELQQLDSTEAVTERSNEILAAVASVGEQLHGGDA